MSRLMLDVDQAGELKAAFRREGPWTNEEIKMLCERKGFLKKVREALLGYAEIKHIEYMIDCDAAPFVPDEWGVEEHQKGGQFHWSPTAVKFHLDPGQEGGKYIEGNELCKRLAGQPVLNANVLDHLLAHPHLIPEEWKNEFVFFWGTIYYVARRLYVRCLYWDRDSDSWYWRAGGLGSSFGGFPTAVRAS